MATTTTNYGMTKPAQTDYYDVDIFNGNADIADAALKDLEDTKLDADGDASNLSLDTITSSSASYPTFTSGLLLKTIFGRIQKFLSDLKANCVTSLSVSGKTITYTKAGGSTGTITTQDTTYSAATTSKAGLMSAADKTKLDGIAAGAQANSITGVKGNAESTYRTGQVNLTVANIGAAAASHNHAASAITSGTLGVARGGTGHDTLTANAIIAGNTTSAVKQIATASGALYATAANGAPKFGTLPIAQGGTGATSASAARTNLNAQQALATCDATLELNKASWTTSDQGMYFATFNVGISPAKIWAISCRGFANLRKTDICQPYFSGTDVRVMSNVKTFANDDAHIYVRILYT